MSIETDLKQEKVSYLDLIVFAKVPSGASVRAVVEQMRRERRNCALILDDEQGLIGIFTDRDVLNKIVHQADTWDKPIDDYMTPQPASVNPQDSADIALNLMEKRRFRNVPVVDEAGHIHGNVSHYAFIKYLADRFPQEVYNLPPDDGISEDRYGG